ncbi:MAG TPA: hypothetical protein VFK50_05675 [Sphingomicrobium sp.]|nr:hypothetical protein [Sphingomicrobium sp.]
MIWRYIGLVVAFAFSRSLLLTDRLSFMIGPLITAVLWLRGEPVPDNVAALIATATVATIAAVLLLRLLAAPFFVWKEDQLALASLRDQVGRPERVGAEEFSRIKAKRRLELVANLRDMHWSCYRRNLENQDEAMGRTFRLMTEVNPPLAFWSVFRIFQEACVAMNGGTDDDEQKGASHRCIDKMVDYLHGQKSVEDLERFLKEERVDEQGK